MVTAPVSKNKWLASGLPYRGHTDFLATVAKDGAPAMFFWSPGLKVALFTHHIALREVFARLDAGKGSGFCPPGRMRNCGGCFAQEFTYLVQRLEPPCRRRTAIWGTRRSR